MKYLDNKIFYNNELGAEHIHEMQMKRESKTYAAHCKWTLCYLTANNDLGK